MSRITPNNKNIRAAKSAVAGAMVGLACVLPTPVFASAIDRPFLRANAVVIVFGASDFIENGGQGGIVTDFLFLDTASGTAATDIIPDDGVTINFNTGQFNPIQNGESSGIELEVTGSTFGGNFTSAPPNQTLDAADSFSAFGVDGNTDIEVLNNGARASRFFVASNTAFDIYGQVSDVVASGDFSSLDLTNIRYRLRVQTTGGGGANRWGANAQDPSIGGDGVVIGQQPGPLVTLDALEGVPVKVFDGGRRTAAQNGSILSQAVSFQSRYNLRGAGNLSNSYDLSQGIGTLSADVTYTVFTP